MDSSADIEAIKQLKARYFRTMDTKDWSGMRAVFTDDVVIDTTASGGGRIEGGDDFMAFLSETLAEAVTIHHGHMPEIQIESQTSALGVWALQDTIVWPNGMRLQGFGHYHERYRRVEGHWLIEESILTRLHMDFSGAESVD